MAARLTAACLICGSPCKLHLSCVASRPIGLAWKGYNAWARRLRHSAPNGVQCMGASPAAPRPVLSPV